MFDEDFLRRLEPLRLLVRRRIRGRREGERATPRRGGSSEFHSYRPYAQGDDPRLIDWNLYARLGSLFIRQHVRDEAPDVHVFIDTSASMAFGKLEQAAKITAAVAAIAFGEYATLHLQGEKGHESLPTLFRHLESLRAGDGCRFAEQAMALRGTGAIVLFLSDCWDEELRAPVLHATAKGEVALIHLLSAAEAEPSVEGRIRFVDSESGRSVSRFVGEEERAEYRTLLDAHCGEWKRWATDHEISYMRCTTATPMEEAVLVLLRESNIVT